MTERGSFVIRALYGRNPDHIEDPAPFATDVLRVFGGIVLFVFAVVFPRVGFPLLALYLLLLARRPIARAVARRRA